jgi:hypothetical protein
MVTFTHTTNRAELADIYIGLQLGHAHLLTDNVCSLCLMQGYIRCPAAYRHHIHRDTLVSITNTRQTRCNLDTRTHLGVIRAHSRCLGNNLVDALASKVTDGHLSDTTYTTGSKVYIGT